MGLFSELYEFIGYGNMPNSNKKNQSNLDAALFGLSLDRESAKPLHVQLVEALRGTILSVDNASGLRLPSGRLLAKELSVSRITVTTAFDQLTSEGYLVARRGSGTYIADHLHTLARPGHRVQSSAPTPVAALPFQIGLPDAKFFPHRLWSRHLEQAWRHPPRGLLEQPDPLGWFPLRHAICEHLSAWRGVECHPEQVLITAGATEALQIISHALLEPEQEVAIEDPGWQPLRNILAHSGLRQVPVRVDDQGLNPADLKGGISAVFITPSRHFPTGKAMPLQRRLALLDYAKRHDCLIIEDDYDSEFRYVGQPLPSLAGLDGLRDTIYLGSFSKILSPALRLGYMVLPEALLSMVKKHLETATPMASLVPQPALAELMQTGDFAVHLRRMRRTYAKRQACLVSALQDATEFLQVEPDASGMHLCCAIKTVGAQSVSDTAISKVAAGRQLYVRALSSQSVLADPPQGVLLGYAAFDEKKLEKAARTLTSILLYLSNKDERNR